MAQLDTTEWLEMIRRGGPEGSVQAIQKRTAEAALAAGFTPNEIRAGMIHEQRKQRMEHPPGRFDRAGRWTADERTRAVASVRSPSRAFPLSENQAARTAAHCAEVFQAESELAVKRVARAYAIGLEIEENRDTMSADEILAKQGDAARALKPVRKIEAPAKTEVSSPAKPSAKAPARDPFTQSTAAKPARVRSK